MGLTAALIACRVGAEPAAVGSWTPFSDVAEGWLLRRGWMVGENAEGLAGLLGGVVGPALAAFVVDSDFCVVVGAVDGTVAWRWVFNEERVYDEVGRSVGAAADPPEDPDAALAARIRAVVPRIAEWSRIAGLSPVAHEPLEGWQAFVRTHELEAWGEPPALVVEGRAMGGGPTLWDVYLRPTRPCTCLGSAR